MILTSSLVGVGPNVASFGFVKANPYAGPTSWVELQRELPFEGTPVLSDAEFERASDEIRAITSEAGQPVLV